VSPLGLSDLQLATLLQTETAAGSMRTMQTMARGRDTGSVNSPRSRPAQHGPTRPNQRGAGRPSGFASISPLPGGTFPVAEGVSNEEVIVPLFCFDESQRLTIDRHQRPRSISR